jgi:hypothetical protein
MFKKINSHLKRISYHFDNYIKMGSHILAGVKATSQVASTILQPDMKHIWLRFILAA